MCLLTITSCNHVFLQVGLTVTMQKYYHLAMMSSCMSLATKDSTVVCLKVSNSYDVKCRMCWKYVSADCNDFFKFLIRGHDEKIILPYACCSILKGDKPQGGVDEL